ncbi:MAG: hypothetical protein ACJ758_05395 [Actinomycetota bacterium]
MSRGIGWVAAAACVSLLAVGCSGGGDAAPTPTPTSPITTISGKRPSSPAVLKILEPKTGQVIHGTSTELKLDLKNAKVVPTTTTNIDPTHGHVHVYLDNQLVSMNFQLSQQLGNLTPGQHFLRCEFVAADHGPFDPRVITSTTFTVKP